MKPVDTSLLPRSARELVDLIGLPATLRLVEQKGGCMFDVAHGRRERGRAQIDQLAAIVGKIAANKIAVRYGGAPFTVPMCAAALRAAVDAAIQARFDELTAGGHSARKTVHRLAAEFGMHERSIWRALKRPTSIEAVVTRADDTQADLFAA